MQSSFTVDLNLTRSEFVSAMFRAYLISRRARIALFMIIGVMVFSDITLWTTTAKKPDLSFSFIASGVPLIVILLVYAGFGLFACFYFYAAKPYLFRNVTYQFTHWGMEKEGEMVHTSNAWREITKFKESKNYFFIYTGGIDVHFIQKRMFTDFLQVDQFRDMLKENIKR